MKIMSMFGKKKEQMPDPQGEKPHEEEKIEEKDYNTMAAATTVKEGDEN